MEFRVACEPVFNISSKSVKSKVACKLVCKGPSNPVKYKVLCETIFDVPSKSLKSSVACKPVSKAPSKLGKLKFTCKPDCNVPSKHVKPNFPRKSISKVTLELSNSFVRKSASVAFDSPDPSLTCKVVNITSSKSVKTHAVCKSLRSVSANPIKL